MDERVVDLDLRGLRCPLPALRTEKQLRAMQAGERLKVLTDDPLAAIDIPHFCRAAGHAVIANRTESGYRHFLIECGGSVPSPK
jgi:tRNA 2-thiouridine synthesizing protein A